NTLLHYQFPTAQYLEKVEAPIRIVHGTSDFVIAHQHSINLTKKKKAIQLVIIKGGSHNNLFEYKEARAALKKWLA
ncbi:MAG: alpha/beta hydrolase, partial [Bacteroidetes bacterium]|nr:alpha/beta hydrolase [Bacteroidota bacterium]